MSQTGQVIDLFGKQEVRPNGTGCEDAFDQFWQLYPRRVAKKAARTAFAKIDPADHLDIFHDLRERERLKVWDTSRKEFIPYPATYLNGERWTDELEDCRTPGEKAMDPGRTLTQEDIDNPFAR